MSLHRKIILGEIEDERRRQIAKWGKEHQTHPHTPASAAPGMWYWRHQMRLAKARCDSLSQEEISWEEILWEEITEAFSETDWPARRKELIQVMAVACAEVEDGDKKERLETLARNVIERNDAMQRHPASRTRAQAEYECDECDEYTPNSVVDGVLFCDRCQPLTQVSRPGDSEQNAAGAST